MPVSYSSRLRRAYQRADNSGDIISPDLLNSQDDNDYVLVSFQYLQKGYDLDDKSLTKDHRVNLLSKLVLITQSTWTTLLMTSKRSGFEMIERAKTELRPRGVTDDVKKFIVARFSSQKCRLIGFRRDNVFFILYIDAKLTAYKH